MPAVCRGRGLWSGLGDDGGAAGAAEGGEVLFERADFAGEGVETADEVFGDLVELVAFGLDEEALLFGLFCADGEGLLFGDEGVAFFLELFHGALLGLIALHEFFEACAEFVDLLLEGIASRHEVGFFFGEGLVGFGEGVVTSLLFGVGFGEVFEAFFELVEFGGACGDGVGEVLFFLFEGGHAAFHGGFAFTGGGEFLFEVCFAGGGVCELFAAGIEGDVEVGLGFLETVDGRLHGFLAIHASGDV